MVITVSCPSCSTSFPVDSAKVPPKGVNARCSACGDIFRIEKPIEGADSARTAPKAVPPPPLPPLPPPPPPVDESADLGGIDVVPPPAPPVAATPKPAAPKPVPPPEPPKAAPPPPEPPSSAPPAGGTFRFGKRDPTDKAKRLARVLVSDMIMYNAERHRDALENGTLAEDFEDEIEKSWKEYVDQVGSDIAEGEGREFWRDALNDILAKGEKIF